jgi:hypothetical protein
MTGLREKIADLVDAISRNEVSEPTDAVLQVLAEHGDTQQVREGAVTVLVATELLGELGDWSQPVRVRVDETPGTGTGYEMTFQTLYEDDDDDMRDARGRAEADLAAAQMALRVARHRLDKVRKLAAHHAGTAQFATKKAWIEVLRILDAPARPAGHDETGQ